MKCQNKILKEFHHNSYKNYRNLNYHQKSTSTTNEEICKIISSLNTNESCVPNSIPTKVLHLLQDQISNHLGIIGNLSFSTGVFLAILKTAEVIPTHK